MATYEINAKKIIQGESSADYVSDRGFSPDSYGLNLTKTRGMLYFNPDVTDIGGATLAGNPIAYSYDKTLSGNDNYFVDDEGNFYTLASDGTFTLRQTITADTFVRGTTDILPYATSTSASYVFATSETRIIRFTGSNLASAAPDTDFWSGLNTGVRHPIERVEDKVFFGDFNLIHAWDGTTSTSAWVTLPPDVNITSLRKHPDGKHLIAFCGLSQNYSHQRASGGRIYLVDVSLRDWIREIDIDEQVEGSRTVGGTVFVTSGFNVGFFNGNGIEVLKRLSTSQTTYSHEMGNLEDIFLVRDGRNVLAFGDLGAGKVWWNCFRNTTNTDNIQVVAYRGDNKVIFGFDNSAAGFLKQVDYDSSGANGQFYSNRDTFGSEVKIRRIDFIHDLSNASGSTQFNVTYRGFEVAGESTVEQISYSSQSKYKTRIHTDITTDIFSLGLNLATDDIGFKLIRVHYDPIK